MKFSDEQKKELVSRYHGGESASDICLQNGVPRSTFYTWLKPYQTEITPSEYIVSANEFIKMKQQLAKLEQKIEVLQKVGCTVSSRAFQAIRTIQRTHFMHFVFFGVSSTITSSVEKK